MLIVVVLMFVCGVQTLSAQSCTSNIRFVADVTVPDDTVYQPNAPFEKIWKFENSGSCDWTDDYSMAFVDGDSLNAVSPQRLGRTVAAGQTTDIGIVMRAPADVGTYTSRWQFQDTAGNPFGDPFYVRIRVMQPGSPEAVISSPGDGSSVRGQVSVSGSAVHPAFDYFKLEFGPGETPVDSQMTVIGDLTRDQVLDGQLGVWDTSDLDDGVYSLRLRVVDRNGNYEESWVRNLALDNAAPEPQPTEPAVASPTETSIATPTGAPTETPEPTEDVSGPSSQFVDDVIVVMTAIAGDAEPQPLLDSLAATYFPGAEPPAVRPTVAVPILSSPTATEMLPTMTLVPTSTTTPLPTSTPVPVPTDTPTVRAGGGFIGVTGWEPTLPAAVPTESSQSGFIGAAGKAGGNAEEPTAGVQFAAQNGHQVTSFHSYTDTYGYMYVVGEALNVGDVPLKDVAVDLVLLGEDGIEMGVNDYNRISMDVVPVDGKLPFNFSVDEAMQNWASVDFAIDSAEFDPDKSYFRPATGLSVANVVPHPTESEYGDFSLTGNVVNSGDAPARMVKLVVVAYDENGQVVDTNSSSLPLDIVLPGGVSPFELRLDGFKQAPYDYEILVQGRQDTDVATQQSEVPIKVTQVTTYLNDWEQLYIVGEAVNEGAVPARDIRAVASLVDANGDVLDLSTTNWADLELVPPGAVYPFSFYFSDEIADWQDVVLFLQAYPYDEEKAYFKPHEDLAVENLVGMAPETEYDEYKFVGDVVNNGTLPAKYIKVVIVARGEDGSVVDVSNASPEVEGDALAAGAAAPFELVFSGIKEAPSDYDIFVSGRLVEAE